MIYHIYFSEIFLVTKIHNPFLCLFTWSVRWSDLEKALVQIWHLNGLTPVCFRLCLVNSSDRANFQPQSDQGQVYGFSPVWVRKCAYKNGVIRIIKIYHQNLKMHWVIDVCFRLGEITLKCEVKYSVA